MKRPPSLKSGDLIGIFAPARKINLEELNFAVQFFETNGFKVIFSEKLFATDRQFAGSDEARAGYLQEMLDNDDIRAVISARGGYGSVRIIDKIDFGRFAKNPKWLIGYSDITVFHSHINKNLAIETLQAAMPLGLENNTKESSKGIIDIIKGETPSYQFSTHPLNKSGIAKGILTGGNLSVLYSLLGSKSLTDMTGKILFIEDLDEYLYHIDRMMMALKRAGVLKDLAGLVVGGMTGMRDNEIPFGKSAEEIIRETVDEFNYPVCFGFPAGHQPVNLPLIMGATVSLEQGEHNFLRFL